MTEHNGILILAEAYNDGVHPVTFELLSKGRKLARTLHCKVDCLLLCKQTKNAEEMNFHGADTVYVMQSDAFAYPEESLYKSNIVSFIKQHMPSIVLFGATDFGRSLAPRVAAALKVGLTADCTDLLISTNTQSGKLIQVRPAFSDNILAHITSKVNPQMATVRYGEFAASSRDQGRNVNILNVHAYHTTYDGTTITELVKTNELDISEAQVVVACGRGLKAAEDMELIHRLARCLGGHVGFSRALIDAGIGETSCQIGYSGRRVRPSLYIACGISGAPQHVAGMKEAKTIVAINRDGSAPIFNICDIGYVGDLYQVVPQLIKELEATS